MRRLDQSLAPPAEADDRGIDHRRPYAAAGAPGCLSGCARANASFFAHVAAMRDTVGYAAKSTLKKFAPATWLTTQMSATVICSPWQYVPVSFSLARCSSSAPNAARCQCCARLIDLELMRKIFAYPRNDQRMGIAGDDLRKSAHPCASERIFRQQRGTGMRLIEILYDCQ